jgi:hypothetical protein
MTMLAYSQGHNYLTDITTVAQHLYRIKHTPLIINPNLNLKYTVMFTT